MIRWNIGIKRTWATPATIQYDSIAKIINCAPCVKTSFVVLSRRRDEK